MASVQATGADKVLDYRMMDLTELSGTFDVVLDMVGGDLGSASIQAFKRGGVIIGIVTPPSTEKAAAGVRHLRVTHVNDGARLALIADLASGGKLAPVVDPLVLALPDAVRGFDALRENTAYGKVVISAQLYLGPLPTPLIERKLLCAFKPLRHSSLWSAPAHRPQIR